jgi:hypothetical protein
MSRPTTRPGSTSATSSCPEAWLGRASFHVGAACSMVLVAVNDVRSASQIAPGLEFDVTATCAGGTRAPDRRSDATFIEDWTNGGRRADAPSVRRTARPLVTWPGWPMAMTAGSWTSTSRSAACVAIRGRLHRGALEMAGGPGRRRPPSSPTGPRTPGRGHPAARALRRGGLGGAAPRPGPPACSTTDGPAPASPGRPRASWLTTEVPARRALRRPRFGRLRAAWTASTCSSTDRVLIPGEPP